MKLSYEQLAAISSGAVRTWTDEQGFHACRFTREHTEAYLARREDFYYKALSTSGIVLRFRTDSPRLALSVNTGYGYSRRFFAVDVLADNRYIGALKNYERPIRGTKYSTLDVPLGECAGVFDLGEGTKTVEVYLPWSVDCVIQSLELDDGASLVPVKREKKLLAFGDSITQGYDALEPRNKYVTRLADRLGMEEINKAIGGEIFWPELAAMKDGLQPDLITVAYGTNDWSNRFYDDLQKASREFFETLRKTYPDATILALTPVWRKNYTQERESYESFHQVEELIRQAVKDLPGITVIRGWELIPQEEAFFGDLALHPSDEGFLHYFENLWKATGWQ